MVEHKKKVWIYIFVKEIKHSII